MDDRSYFETLDGEDPLADRVSRFELPDGLIYLDGNSLGPPPIGVAATVEQTLAREWGQDLIAAWNHHGWWTLARRTGDRIAPLLGVAPGCVIAGDTTTVALYRTAMSALTLRPDRRLILTDTGNFPTDLYALESAADHTGHAVVAVSPEDVIDRVGADVALVALTHVDYRTGRRHDMSAVNRRAMEEGAVTLWDLSHSAGAMELDLTGADFAVGCGYKYLNGGPGAPAYTYVLPGHLDHVVSAISGWWGHADPFAMEPEFVPASGVERMQVGTQPILSLVSLFAALDVFDGVEPSSLRRKSVLLTSSFIQLCRTMVPEVDVVGPSDPAERGSHVALRHPDAGAIMPALRSKGVIGDRRPPDLIRFGFSPIFQRHTDVWDAVVTLRRVLDSGSGGPVDVEGPVT